MLNAKQKKYIHFRSAKNFILHLENITLQSDKVKCYFMLNEYMECIENNVHVIDSKMATSLFTDYIHPIGEVYRGIGFKQITPMRNRLFFTIHIDVIAGILFLKFPYPILTVLVILDYYIRQRKHIHATKTFGIFF